MLKMPKEDSESTWEDGFIRINEKQKLKEISVTGNAIRGHDEILKMVKMASHDIRGAAVSAAAALKLINKGFFGKVDEGISNELKKLLEKMAGIIGIVEDSMIRSFCLDGELDRLREELDLHLDILEPVLAELDNEIRDTGVIIYNTQNGTPNMAYRVKGNRFLLKAVIRNLLKNAIRYGGQGTRIAIGFRNNEDHIMVNIFNSGLPVPQEYRDRLFKKFDRVSPECSTSEGMGLGLYLVKEIITKHGGKIRYEARKQGSNFVFTLPKD
jgi:signal transduction histidine kinase